MTATARWLRMAFPFLFLCLMIPLAPGCAVPTPSTPSPTASAAPEAIQLEPPRTAGEISLEETLAQRRSKREFTDEALTWKEISQLLWAAQGITNEQWGFRTAPSAGGLYPLEIYVVAPAGVYHYIPRDHKVEKVLEGDRRGELCRVALDQACVAEAAIDIVVTAVYQRTINKYGAERSPRYVHLEAGHVGQNILLQAVALGLGAVPVGAFYDAEVQEVLGLPADHEPLYIIPVGHPK